MQTPILMSPNSVTPLVPLPYGRVVVSDAGRDFGLGTLTHAWPSWYTCVHTHLETLGNGGHMHAHNWTWTWTWVYTRVCTRVCMDTDMDMGG